jgi:hypothetical protein
MRCTTVFVVIVFVAGLGVGYFARSAGMGTARRWDTHAPDLAAIGKLHKKNIEVTLSQDPPGLLDLWTEDGVLLEPGSLPIFHSCRCGSLPARHSQCDCSISGYGALRAGNAP